MCVCVNMANYQPWGRLEFFALFFQGREGREEREGPSRAIEDSRNTHRMETVLLAHRLPRLRIFKMTSLASAVRNEAAFFVRGVLEQFPGPHSLWTDVNLCLQWIPYLRPECWSRILSLPQLGQGLLGPSRPLTFCSLWSTFR